MYYLPGAGSLQRAMGRQVAGVVSATATGVVGLRDIQFDNGDHYLVAEAGNKYRAGLVGDTVTFADLATITAGTQLEAVHYRNRFFLFNGASASASAIGTNTVVYLSATAANSSLIPRQHGLLPVVAAPITASANGTFSQTVTGYYEYWTTEVARLIQDGAELVLESAFSADSAPTTVYVSAVGLVPIIQMPALQNPSITTHWRVYRSPKKDKESDKKFPIGFMIAEAAASGVSATATISDTSVAVSTAAFPTTYNTSAPYSDFTNRTNLGADDNAYASAVVVLTPQHQAAYGFNFGGFGGSVKGITVETQGYIAAGTGPVPIQATIGKRASNGDFTKKLLNLVPIVASKSAQITATNSGSPQTVTMGSPTDRWFPSDQPGLTPSDFDGNFMVDLSVSKLNTSVGLDYVKVTVYYSATVDSVVQFPTVVYTFGDISAQVAKNHPPPSSSTGDLYEDCLVVNDITNPALIRWSFPGDVEYFPPTYFIDFETRENDQVRAIRVVNNRLIVWLDSSSWRVNYLPSERDASFDRGKAIEPISKSFGCVSPMCVCSFSVDGGPEQVAFVSHLGIHATDGFSFDTLTDDLDWRTTVAATGQNYTPIALVNDRERRMLFYYFRNDSYGAENYLALPFSYHGSHLQEGKLKIGGLTHMRNFDVAAGATASLESAWASPRSNGTTSMYLGYGGTATAAGAGKVYIELGTTIPAQDQTIAYSTRDMYRGGGDMGQGAGFEWEIGEVYGYCPSYSGAPVVQYAITGHKTDDVGASALGSKSVTLQGGKMHKVIFRLTSEGMIINMRATATSFAQDFLVIDGSSFGLEDSGR